MFSDQHSKVHIMISKIIIIAIIIIITSYSDSSLLMQFFVQPLSRNSAINCRAL